MYQSLLKQCARVLSSGRTKPVLVSRPARQSRLSFESLEDRKMLAATYELDGGVLTITGTNGPEVVILYQFNNFFEVEEDGVVIDTYSNDDVDNIVFRGKNGNDEFVNNTFETSTFYGHGGDDIFYGGTGKDIAFGGGDNDILYGGIGPDELKGSDGDDQIYGEEGKDRIFGGNGNDRIFGGGGDDFLSAESGDDVMFGGPGNDYFRGYNGNDEIHGEEGNDTVFGQGGDDTIYGNEGNDRLRGNNDNDTIYGQLGNDVLIGDLGNDYLDGGEGNEIIFPHFGDDISYGGEGDDQIFDSDGNDQLYGGNGNDLLRSGSGNDHLEGGDGADVLRAEAGRDSLYGDGGLDKLYGGWGDDSLHGGAGPQIDQIRGEQGSDRFHQDDSDSIVDRVAEDVTIEYRTTFVDWADGEIRVLDKAFTEIYQFVGSQDLLRESHSGNDNVTIVKYQDLPGQTVARNIINSSNQRQIQIIDFDETTVIGQTFFQSEILRQIGHNWNSTEELAAFSTSAVSDFSGFLAASQWTQTNPQNSNFEQSGDGLWWYSKNAAFTGFEAQENPYADFVSIWELAVTDVFTNPFASKVTALVNVFR